MSKRTVRVILLFVATCVMSAAATPDASLTLTTRGNRTQFRMGEQIDVELRFATTTPGRWRMAGNAVDRRYARQREYDSFTAEPSDNAVDPLADSGTLMGNGMARGLSQQVLGVQPVIVPGIVNDWISFRRAGRYRIVAESERLFVPGAKPERLLLKSNAIDIEILPAGPEWQKRQLAQAQTVLDSAMQQGVNTNRDSVHRAARTLRYLETADAVEPLVRFYTSSLHEIQEEVRAALTASPHRSEVIVRMEQAVAAPDVPTTAYFLGTLMQIEYARRHGAREPLPLHDPEAMKRWNEADRIYMERFRPIQEHYNTKLREALPRKRGEARAVALEALLTDGTQPVASDLRKLVVDEFATLPAPLQTRLLMRWMEIGGPELTPALRAMASRDSEARETALGRLMEVDPAGARAVVLDRIARGDLGDPRGPEPRFLLDLPDKQLPDLDDKLVAALDHATTGPSLVARYAGDNALPRVLQWLKQNPQNFCFTAISAYIFRVDPPRARALLTEARKAGPCQFNLPQYAIWRLISPGLEQAAVESLSDPDPEARRSAQTLLQYGGSEAAKSRLFEAFSALRERPMSPAESPLETGYVDALIQGAGWVLTTAELDEVERLCITDNCRQFAQSQRRALTRPVQLTVWLDMPWQVTVGGSLTFSREQTLHKLKQFPTGTVFQLPEGARLKESTIWQSRVKQVAALISEAGMALRQ